MRDLFEQRKGIGRLPAPILEVPTFKDFATRYLAEDVSHLATSTQRDRALHLREGGPLDYFGERKLDEITPQLLREWWTAEILGRGRTTATGRSFLSTLAGVFGYARDLAVIDSTPIGAFREQIRRRSRTKGARAASEAGATIRPLESTDALVRLVAASEGEAEADFRRATKPARGGEAVPRSLHDRTGGLRAHVAVVLMLDAGLRVGEVAGLTWGQVRWAEGEGDAGRALVIDRARPRRARGIPSQERQKARCRALPSRVAGARASPRSPVPPWP